MWTFPHTFRCRGNKGFTLIELLVAVALSSILLAALYGTFFTVLNTGRAAEDSLDRHIEAGRLLDRFTMDIHSAYYKPRNTRTVFLGETRGMLPAVSFTSFTNPVIKKGLPSSDLAGVSYSSETGEDGIHIFREVWNPYIGDRARVEMVDGGVDGFEISYYNGSSWSKAWDSSLEKTLPKAVRMTLKLKGGEEISALARTMIKSAD